MFKHIPPLSGVYAKQSPARASVETVIQMMTIYAAQFEDLTGRPGTTVTDMRVTSVTTGFGSYTQHHFDDSDYIVHLAVWYSDKEREYECVMGTHNGEISVWLD
jgi:hypothetical protein